MGQLNFSIFEVSSWDNLNSFRDKRLWTKQLNVESNRKRSVQGLNGFPNNRWNGI